MGKIPEEADNRITETFLSLFKTMMEHKMELDTIDLTKGMIDEINSMMANPEVKSISDVNISQKIIDTFVSTTKMQMRGVRVLYDLLEMHHRAKDIMQQTNRVVLTDSLDNVDEEIKEGQRKMLIENIGKWLEDYQANYQKH